jgi:hypothetical protein
VIRRQLLQLGGQLVEAIARVGRFVPCAAVLAGRARLDAAPLRAAERRVRAPQACCQVTRRQLGVGQVVGRARPLDPPQIGLGHAPQIAAQEAQHPQALRAIAGRCQRRVEPREPYALLLRLARLLGAVGDLVDHVGQPLGHALRVPGRERAQHRVQRQDHVFRPSQPRFPGFAARVSTRIWPSTNARSPAGTVRPP